MKKILLALAIGSVSLLSLSSCTKEYITNNELVPSITMIYSNEQNNSPWTRISSNELRLELNVPELTDYYIDQGIVSVAISFNNETTYKTIPTIDNGVSISYDYSIGKVTLIATDPIAEPGTDINVSNNYFVKVSLTDADYVE